MRKLFIPCWISIAILLITLNGCNRVVQGTVSSEELVELLGIIKYTIPMPKDKAYEWSFDIVDYKTLNEIKTGEDTWMDPVRTASIYFMPLQQIENGFKFWIKQDGGISSGNTRIDVCDNPDDLNTPCHYQQINIKWEKTPVRIDDGKSFLLCTIEEINGNRKKMLIAYLLKYRL